MAAKSFEVTHPDRVMFPAADYTKADVLAYYREAARFILPHLRNRPLTLKLYPNGVRGKHIYLKNAPVHTPSWVKTFAVERKDKSRGTYIHFVLVNTLRTLLWAANLSSLEMHTFLAKAPNIQRPTSVVFDLDPGEPATVLECAEVALKLKDLLSDLKLKSFVKGSGSKGLQVYVPLDSSVTYEVIEPFAQLIAEQMEERYPKLVVSRMAKALRPGKVFIDWSQNVYYKTTVCVYSLRAKKERPFISMPFTWQEVKSGLKAADGSRFYLEPQAALRRLARTGELFEEVLTLKQELPATAKTRPGRDGTPANRTSKRSPKRRFTGNSGLHRMLAKLPKQKVGFMAPMQPEVVSKLPRGPQWQYELKWDGYRAIVVKRGKEVILYSRNENNLTARYPAIVHELQEVRFNEAVLDGEIVALDEKGRPSFQLLQNYNQKRGVPLSFVAFDVLNLEGHSLISLPLSERQHILKELVPGGANLQLSEPLNADLETVLRVVREQQLEGVVAKDRTSQYVPGQRGAHWFKQRIGLGQEFVVGGYSRGDPFSSLLVGYYVGRKLHYAGKVKAGFIKAVRRQLIELLSPLIIDDCPFVDLPHSKSGRWGEGLTAEEMAKCVWVKPKLVVQVTFVEWTAHGHLRHARYLGRRDDKKASQVRRES